jgi:hypothetical protein
MDTAAAGGVEALLTEARAAIALHLKPYILRRLRLDGGGPCFVMLPGTRMARYRPSALNQWSAGLQVGSVAEVIARNPDYAEDLPLKRERRAIRPRSAPPHFSFPTKREQDTADVRREA